MKSLYKFLVPCVALAVQACGGTVEQAPDQTSPYATATAPDTLLQVPNAGPVCGWTCQATPASAADGYVYVNTCTNELATCDVEQVTCGHVCGFDGGVTP